jgi:pimeloyl-ACP methyl ester carboxylesterase
MTNASCWAGGSQGIPVVLIHGLGGYQKNWMMNFDDMAAARRVISWDRWSFPG